MSVTMETLMSSPMKNTGRSPKERPQDELHLAGADGKDQKDQTPPEK
ncbi:hypothetical protein Pcinc_015528, partial [Petrolisthes cinctipes]